MFALGLEKTMRIVDCKKEEMETGEHITRRDDGDHMRRMVATGKACTVWTQAAGNPERLPRRIGNRFCIPRQALCGCGAASPSASHLAWNCSWTSKEWKRQTDDNDGDGPPADLLEERLFTTVRRREEWETTDSQEWCPWDDDSAKRLTAVFTWHTDEDLFCVDATYKDGVATGAIAAGQNTLAWNWDGVASASVAEALAPFALARCAIQEKRRAPSARTQSGSRTAHGNVGAERRLWSPTTW